MNELRFRNDVLPLKDRLFRLALRITFNREDAEDIVQETMLRVWREMNEGDDIMNVEAFAMTVCRNLSLDNRVRLEQQNVSFTETLHDRPDTAQSPSEQLEQSEQIGQVHQWLNQLPEKQRTAIQLRDIEGRSYKEIAEVMSISESDVKVNIFRARQKLKEKLNKQTL